LAPESPQERAAMIIKFIHLAVELQKLGNFHGLMAVLTALLQGCISRLLISFDLIAKADIQQLSMLKVLKNLFNFIYLFYFII
jgi:hypothetical protein